MARLNIDFVLLDESVVLYGFRALMAGYQPEGFEKNAVMLMMHARAEPGYNKPLEENVVLPIGKWYDIRVEGNRLLAKPEFDDDDEFAQRIQKKVEKGYLNAASVWIDPLAATDEETLKLPGQVGPTITKWGVFEASIVDIPNCRGALAIRNSAGKKVALNSGAPNTEVLSYLNSLIPAGSEKLSYRVIELVENAISEGRLTTADKSNVYKLAAFDYNATKALLDRLQPMEVQELSQNVEVQELAKLSGRELYMQGKLERLKALSPSHFRLKFKEFFGKDYTGGDIKENPPVEAWLSAHNPHNAELVELLKLSGRELYLQGKFERLKELSPQEYGLKHKEYFGKEPA